MSNELTVKVHKADTGRHVHDYYEGDVLKLSISSDGYTPEQIEFKINFGSDTSFAPNITDPCFDEFNENIYCEWNTEGIRLGMYTIEATATDGEKSKLISEYPGVFKAGSLHKDVTKVKTRK